MSNSVYTSISKSVHTSLVKYNSRVSTKASMNERSDSTFYSILIIRFSYLFFFQISCEQINQISYLLIHASVASVLKYVTLPITSWQHKLPGHPFFPYTFSLLLLQE